VTASCSFAFAGRAAPVLAASAAIPAAPLKEVSGRTPAACVSAIAGRPFCVFVEGCAVAGDVLRRLLKLSNFPGARNEPRRDAPEESGAVRFEKKLSMWSI
jgi:hypothetical protein